MKDRDLEEEVLDLDDDGEFLQKVGAKLVIPTAAAALLLLAEVIAVIVLTGRSDRETPDVVRVQEEQTEEQTEKLQEEQPKEQAEEKPEAQSEEQNGEKAEEQPAGQELQAAGEDPAAGGADVADDKPEQGKAKEETSPPEARGEETQQNTQDGSAGGTESADTGKTPASDSAETLPEAQEGGEAPMDFAEVNETVTAKDSTNLRDTPSQGTDSTVVYTLQNGETVARTGVSDSGWSRLTYNGQTVYAVSSYLTTDLEYQPPAQAREGAESGDGLKTRFAERNEQMTAKIEVNLRALPSVTNPDATVVAVLHNGEYVTRTGINEDVGWSRVNYNGQTLYCISSYLTN